MTKALLKLLGTVVVFTTIFFFGTAAAQSSDPMKFDGVPPKYPILGNAWRVFDDGVIDIDTAEKFEEYLQKNDVPRRSIVFLNSPGGNLMGGIKLGKVIRKWGLFTYIARKSADPEKHIPGECYSACALSFLGGEYRFTVDKSVYGVHRFYFTSKVPGESDIAQIMSASVVQYIRDMEVNTELFSIMTQAGANDIITIPDAEMVRLNVINNGVKRTKWSIESIPSGIYLKGERETFRGINKFIILCSSGHRMGLHVIFDPEGRGDEIVKVFNATSIFIDDKTIPINQYMVHRAELVNGWINIQYAIDDALLRRIANAHTVGVAVQMVYGAPTFMGFEGMDFSDGAKKLPGFLGVCRGK